MKIKIKWMIRKDMTYENTYRDDIKSGLNLNMTYILILLTKFDLSISNSLNQMHIEKISFKRHELHTDQGL